MIKKILISLSILFSIFLIIPTISYSAEVDLNYSTYIKDFDKRNDVGSNKGLFRKITKDYTTIYYSYLKYSTEEFQRYLPKNITQYAIPDLLNNLGGKWGDSLSGVKKDDNPFYIYTDDKNHFTNVSYLENDIIWESPNVKYKNLELFIGNETNEDNVRQNPLDVSIFPSKEYPENNLLTFDEFKGLFKYTDNNSPVDNSNLVNFVKTYNNVNVFSIHVEKKKREKNLVHTYAGPFTNGGGSEHKNHKIKPLVIPLNDEYGYDRRLHRFQDFYYYKLNFLVNNEVVHSVITEGLDKINLKASWYLSEGEQNNPIVSPTFDISHLPSTEGNLSNVSGSLGYCDNIVINDNLLSFKVTYQSKVFNIGPLSFESNDKLDFIKDVNNFIYFTNDENEHIFYIVKTEDSDFKLYNQQDVSSVKKWNGHTFWNYEKNEISTQKKVEIFMVDNIEKENSIAFYAFIPDIMYDKIVQLGFNFSYYLDEKRTGQPINQILILDESSTTKVTPAWLSKTIKTSTFIYGVVAFLGAGVTLLTAGTAAPLASILIASVGAGVMLGGHYLADHAYKNQWMAYNIKCLENNPDVSDSVFNKLQNHIYNTKGFIPSNYNKNSIRKINLGNTFNSETIFPDESKTIVSHLVLEFKGEKILIDKDSIKNNINFSPLYPGNNPSNQNDFMDKVVYYLKLVLIVMIIAIPASLGIRIIASILKK